MKPRVLHQGQNPLLADTIIEGMDRDHPLLKNPLALCFTPIILEVATSCSSSRLMVSLMMLAYMYNLSDERVVELWAKNPYWQSFGGL